MHLNNDFQDDQKSITDSSIEDDNQPLRRHQAQDEEYKSLFGSFKKKRGVLVDDEKKVQNGSLSRIEQKQRDKDANNELKARRLGKKLNKVIWTLIGLIVLTYLIMKFVNF